MINITIGENGASSPNMINLGSQFENLDEVIQFTFPSDLEPLNKYVVAKTYDSEKKENITRVTPLVDNRFVIGSAITKVTGAWLLYTLCKSYSADSDNGTIDNIERVSISDPILASITENNIDIGEIEGTEIDPNIKIIYDELIEFKKTLEASETTRQSNEAIRVENETSRVSAETARKEAETMRVDNETSRLNAESTRASAEVARSKAEETRASNETARQSAESQRERAETARKEAENTHSNNEQTRINAESERMQYETLRRQSEGIRLANEESRSNAEKTRIQSEEARINAENERTIAETARQSAESNRANAETNRTNAERLRKEAETSRINAEQSRADAETLRASAENERVIAENLRVEAENKRDSVITKLKEDLDANTKADGRTQRSLTALWDLNKGISYRFETDTEKAYKKQVPSGAKLGAVNKIGGKTIVYNQLIDPSKREEIDFDEQTNHFKYSNWTVTTGNKYICTGINVIGGHKYYLYATDKVRYAILYMDGDGFSISFTKPGDAETEVKKIFTATNSGKNQVYFNRYIAKPENVSYFDGCINLIDLTNMFGSGNEPSTVEEFEAMFPNDYYPYNEGELTSMSVNDVVYTDTSGNLTSHQIPQSILDLDGYGWSAGAAHNYVDFENKKFYKNVGRVNLDDYEWTAFQRDIEPFYYSNTVVNELLNGARNILNLVGIISTYNLSTNTRLVYKNGTVLDETNKPRGYLYFELAEPIVTDISDIIGDTFQEPFVVESGGSLTFKNVNGDGYKLAVPNEEQYTVSLKEVNS